MVVVTAVAVAWWCIVFFAVMTRGGGGSGFRDAQQKAPWRGELAITGGIDGVTVTPPAELCRVLWARGAPVQNATCRVLAPSLLLQAISCYR
eukprot:s148_g3.t1